MKKYKVLKYIESNGNVAGHFVNDSEGIAMEWENFEDADKIAKLFEQNSQYGHIYKVVL
jgi:hypothetical protein